MQNPQTAFYESPSLHAARRRKAQTQRRVNWLEAHFADDASYRVTVGAGRYIQLCMLTEWACEIDLQASLRLAAEEARRAA